MLNAFQVSGPETLADTSVQREYWRTFLITRAQFSDCGSFCFLNYIISGIFLFLSSTLLEEKQAKMRTAAVWGRETSYNGRLYEVGWRNEPKMVNLYQAINRPLRNGLRDSTYTWLPAESTISVAITALPTHLASAEVRLLAGNNWDNLVQILFLPKKGPPEVKNLRVTLNQILDKLEEATRSVVLLDWYIGADDRLEEGSSNIESNEVAISTNRDESRSSDSN